MEPIMVSDLRTNVRTALADFGQCGVFIWPNESIDAAIRTVIETGIGPRSVSIASLHGTVMLDPPPATPDARGHIVFHAALLLIGGQLPFSWHTRAMSVRTNPRERDLTISHLRRQINRLETDGDPHGDGGTPVFGVWNDLENALRRTIEPVQSY